MDPALREQLRTAEESDPGRIVEAIIRLAHPDAEIPGVRMVARFGEEIATCRISTAAVAAARAHPAVVSLKAARLLSPGTVTATSGPIRRTDVRRPTALEPTGAGVVVGVADWGVDVDCAALRLPSGATRLLALWDQRGDGGPEPYGYGTVHDREAIDAALCSLRPYECMGLHPAVADRGSGAHGLHVVDIAAGNGRGGGPVGLAPEADLVFVHLADRDTGGTSDLGDSVRLLEAVDFIRRAAGERPWVINLSVGRCGGPHDGGSLVELAFDALLDEAPGRMIVQSAGNYYQARTHTAGRVRAGETRSFTFISRPGDATQNELEIWYDGRDVFDVRIDPPGSAPSRPVPLGEYAEPFRGGRIYHRRDPTGSNHVDAFLDPAGRSGRWTVTVEGRRVVNGRFDAWLERDDACPRCQPRFSRADSVPTGSTGTIANGHVPLVVGAYDGHDPARQVARFSSVGPTRDGREKPDCAAEGVAVLAARSAAAGTARNAGLLVRKSGTSMAAPHVTGSVALALQLAGHRLTARRLRAAVLESCDPPLRPDPERRLGHGRLNVARLLATIRRAVTATDMESIMNTDFLGVTPATVYREFLYHPDGPMAHWIDDRYDLVARPNHRATRTPATGDVAIEVTLGSNHPGQCTVLDAVTADRFAALRRQPAGRLVLRPRSSAVPPRDEDESDLSAHEAQTGTLVRVGSQRSWTYPFTTDDLQWTAKLLVHEAGGTDDADNAAVLWAMFNKYALFAHRRYDTFSTFIRAYSTTLQPVLRSARAAARHAYKPPSEFVRTGGTYPGTGILRGQLRRHLDIQQAPWQSIKLSARDLAVRALSGRLPNPGIGLASEFASTRIYFRQRHGRNPSRDEWRAYTMDLASRKNWRWIGEVPGLDQMRNAFFLDLRAAGLPGDAVHIRRPEGSRQGGE